MFPCTFILWTLGAAESGVREFWLFGGFPPTSGGDKLKITNIYVAPKDCLDFSFQFVQMLQVDRSHLPAPSTPVRHTNMFLSFNFYIIKCKHFSKMFSPLSNAKIANFVGFCGCFPPYIVSIVVFLFICLFVRL